MMQREMNTVGTTRPNNRMKKTQGKQTLSCEDRYRLISERAYLIAESRGFQNGCPTQDWLKAEAEIDSKYGCCS